MSESPASPLVSRGNLLDATPAQATQLAEFGARTFYEAFAAENTPEDMRRHLQSAWNPRRQLAEIQDPRIDTLLLVEDAGPWMAFAQLRTGETSEGVPAEGSIELWRFYVDRPWQGRST
jgi:diamine N-acetyltransferase